MTSRFKRLPDPLLGDVSGDRGLVMHASPATAHEWSDAVSDGVFSTRPWWEEYVAAGLPAPPGPWRARMIPAGIWLYSGTPSVEDATRVASIPVESDRMAVAVGAGAPSQAILDVIAALLNVLPPDSPRAVRLLMPLLDMRVAQAFADEHRVDLVATQGQLILEPGRVVTSGLDDTWGAGFWQWYRVRPGRDQEPYGALHPRPVWERALTAAGRHPAVPSARIGRVAAGLTLGPLGVPDPRFVEFASGIGPGAAFKVIVQANGLDPLLMSACTALLRELPWETVRQTQLIWPYAAAETARRSIRELAEDLGVEITAPAAGLRLSEDGNDVHGVRSDGMLGPWVRFTPGEPDSVEGAVLPAPAWNAKLRPTPVALPADMMSVRVEAGLYLTAVRENPEYGALVGALVPDREAMTVFVDGDAARTVERRPLQTLLDGIDPSLLPGMRLVMRSAADGGSGSFAQMLANRYRVRISVATTESLGRTVAQHGQAELEWVPFRPLTAVPVPVRSTGTTSINAPLGPVSLSLAPAVAKASAAQPVTGIAIPVTARPARETPAWAPEVSGGRPVRAVSPVRPIPDTVPTPPVPTPPVPTPPLPTPPLPTGTKTVEASRPQPEPPAEPSPPVAAEPPAEPACEQDDVPSPTLPPAPRAEVTVVDSAAPDALLAPPAPTDHAVSAAEPEQTELEPSEPTTLLVRPGDRSADAERHGWRDLIGPRRDTHLVAVSRVLAQHPALRGALSHEPLDGVTSDLAALRSYLEGDLPGIEYALREGNPHIRDAAVCVVSGLRMLPVHSGIAYRTAQLPASALDVYTPGTTVVEPGLLAATSRTAAYGGNVLYAIWSRTARRTAVLGAAGAREEVLFPAGVEFAVLAVEPLADGAGRLVLLAERVPVTGPAESRADNDATLLERMRACATSLSAGAEDLVDAPERYRLPIGLDERHQLVRLS
ncbi:hypothetical protein [Streptomyces sp. NPDC060022]|uniref:hypothetical protein n=1 Tax=Streptomyces sp. NPDC060022 TaxID=3347039 RepID=UPI0036A7F53E